MEKFCDCEKPATRVITLTDTDGNVLDYEYLCDDHTKGPWCIHGCGTRFDYGGK
jgi:hypothetical protein